MIYFKQQLIEINQPTTCVEFLLQWFSNSGWHQNRGEGLSNHRGWAPPSRFLKSGPTLKVSEVWLEPWDFLQVTR